MSVSTQNAAGDHVKESSHRVISSRSSSSSSEDKQLHSLASFTEETSVLTKTIEEKKVRQGSLAVEFEKPKFQLSETKSSLLAGEDLSWMAVAPRRRRSGKSDRGSSMTPSSC